MYLLYGEEIYLIETELKRIKKEFGELIKGINYISLDATSVNSIIPEIETPSFGYEKKLIIIRDSGLFKKTSKKEQKKLSEYIEQNSDNINNSIILAFVEEEITKNELFQTIQKYGEIKCFNELKPFEIQKYIRNICSMYNVNIDNKALQTFVETCGTDLLTLINEIRKLIEYVGAKGTITVSEIEQLSIPKLDSVIFNLTDNLCQKNVKKSLEILHELIYNKEPVQKILVTLYGHFKRLYLTISATEQGRSVKETLKLKANQLFLESKYKRQAAYFKKEEVRNVLQQFIDLDYKYKQGLIDINVGLEAIISAI